MPFEKLINFILNQFKQSLSFCNKICLYELKKVERGFSKAEIEIQRTESE